MKKSRTLFVLISAILAVFLVGIVSAASPIVDAFSSLYNGIIDVLRPILQSIVGVSTGVGTFTTNDIFLVKVLILFILLALVYAVLSRISLFENGNNIWVLWVVSIGVSVLGVRFLTPEYVLAIMLPNSTLAVAITAGLPFVIYFFFANRLGTGFARKAAWIFFAAIFLGLWGLRANDIGSAGNIYLLTILLALLMIIFDGTIQKFFAKARIERMKTGLHSSAALSVQKKLAVVQESYDTLQNNYVGVTEEGSGKRGINAYTADVDFLTKELKKHIVK